MADAEVVKLRESLAKAYELIRSQTEIICDLTALVTPLVKALQPDYDEMPLGEAYRACQEVMQNELSQLKRDSIAAVDDAIRRLRGV